MFTILEIVENEDDEIYSYRRTKRMLENNPGIDAVLIMTGGVYGAGMAIIELPEGMGEDLYRSSLISRVSLAF